MKQSELIVAALEPLVREIAALEKRIETLKLMKGDKGDPGADAPPVDVDAVVKTVLESVSEIVSTLVGPPGNDGADGKDADPIEVATRLKEVLANDEDFVASVRVAGPAGADGAQGVPGDKGDPGARGADGVSIVEIENVGAAMVVHLSDASAHTIALPAGPAGAAGEKGERGADGVAGVSVVDVKAVGQSLHIVLSDDCTHVIPLPEGAPGAAGKDGLGIESPRHKAGEVYREGAIVTAYFGQHYKALKDTYAAPGDPSWERIGTGGFRYRGVFDPEIKYDDGDIVIRDYGAFVCFDGVLTLFCGRGAKGERGAVGPSGKDGKPGKNGSTIVGGEAEGFKAVLMFKDADDNLDHLELDFTAPFEKAIASLASRLLSQIEELGTRVGALELGASDGR